MAEVVLENVTKVYPGGVVAVDGVDLHVRDREFVVLVGPSGCGKSTTLRMIAGLEEVTEGTIRIGERVVNDVPPKDRDAAMVFQNYALYPHMTAYGNMAFSLKLRKYARDEIDRRVGEAARILGIEDLLERRPQALSGGQRQRVAIGRAIVRHPKVFLFDEPLSNLDARMRVEMRTELKRLHKRLNTTMIYVTHDQVEALTLGDRVVVMDGGVVMQAAEPLTVYNHPANRFVANFIGTPPMSLFEGVLEAGDGGFVFDGGAVRLALPEWMHGRVRGHVGGKVVFGIRPESMVLKGDPGADEGVAFAATIDVTEPLGSKVIVHLVAGGHRFQISVDAGRHPALQGRLEVCPLMDRAQVFDGETGVNLTRPESAVSADRAACRSGPSAERTLRAPGSSR